MADVFISYKREDQAIAEQIAAKLVAAGLTVWWDRELKAGKNYFRVIQEELDRAGHVVVLWSKASVESEWVWNEAREANEQGKLIPVRIEECRVPANYGHLQTLEVRAPIAEIGALLAALGSPVSSAATVAAAPAGIAAEPRNEAPPPELAGMRIDFERYNLIGAYGAAVSPAAGLAILGGWDGWAALWDGRSGRLLKTWQPCGAGNLNRFAFDTSGTFLATLSQQNGTARIWKTAETGKPVAEVSHGQNMWGLAFLGGDAPRLLWGQQRAWIDLWSADLKSRAWQTACFFRSVAAAPNASRIAVGCDEGSTRLLDSRDGKLIRDLGPGKGSNPHTLAVAFSPDSARVASGHNGGAVHIWGAATNRPLGEYKCDSDVWSVAFCGNGTLLAAGGADKTARLWDTSTGSEIAKLEGHEHVIRSVAFSRDNRRLLTASQDGTIKIWDVASRQLVATLAAFLDGEYVVIAADGAYAGSPGVEKYLYLMVDGIERGVTDAYRKHYFRPEGIKDLF